MIRPNVPSFARTAAQLGAPADFGPPLVTITFTFLAWAEAAELGTLDGRNVGTQFALYDHNCIAVYFHK